VIVEFPAATPVTLPVPASTVATAVVLLLQAPPETLLLNIIFDPIHTAEAPLIVPALATGFTLMIAEAVADPQILVTE
jgi:hypothetical protein